MYIMCVCLFSALSRRVGALQISIIIIIIKRHVYWLRVYVTDPGSDGPCSSPRYRDGMQSLAIRQHTYD